MRSRRFRLLCALWLACAGVGMGSARAQEERKSFDPAMSLEETVAWLGKQLGHSWTDTSADGRFRRHTVTRVVKAERCTLSYVNESQSETNAGEPTQTADQVRELWTADLSGLDPRTIRVTTPGRVLFTSADTKRDVIRTSVFRNQSFHTAHHNRRRGSFTVADKKAAEVAAALSHAAALSSTVNPRCGIPPNFARARRPARLAFFAGGRLYWPGLSFLPELKTFRLGVRVLGS